jgi:hypothetical protein
MAYLRTGTDGGRQGSSLLRNRIMDIRGDLATGGRLVLSTTEPTVVDGNELGRIDFQAPLDTAGTDAILVAASIYAEADATFSASVNSTDLVFATGDSATASEKLRIDSTGQVTFADGAIDVDIASHDGTTGLKLGGTLVTATAAEINYLAGQTWHAGATGATGTTLADGDRVVVNDAGTMKQVALTDFETYFESALDTLSNVTTVGDLNAGSITSGFGSINNGSSTITTTGALAAGTVDTGQGANELYSMNQAVTTTSGVTFATITTTGALAAGTVDTGQGANELYSMNQDVTTTSGVTFATVNTGQGANELYDMNQNVLTSTNVQFAGGGFGTAGAAGEVRATSNITAYYSSDRRLKENIKKISNALKKLESINGVSFDWTDEHIESRGGEDGYFVNKHEVGVIAQEIKEVLPEVVRERDDGYLGVKYEGIIPLLIEAIKELKQEVEELRN